MVRKSFYVGGAAVLLLVLLFGGDAWSFVKTGLRNTREAVADNIPVEFQIERARNMIKELDPEIQKNMRVIAKEEVEISGLREELEVLEGKLAKSEKDLARLTGDLRRGDSFYVYAGKSYTSTQVKTDLENRFNRHKSLEATAKKLQQIVTTRQQGLAAAQERLVAMKAARHQLEVDVAQLEARLEMVKLAQSSSNMSFDDSKLSRAKNLVRDISTRIDVAEKLVNAETTPAGEIDLDEKSTVDIAEEVAKYLGGKVEHDIVKLD
jgi:Mor family transcriptional regulator